MLGRLLGESDRKGGESTLSPFVLQPRVLQPGLLRPGRARPTWGQLKAGLPGPIPGGFFYIYLGWNFPRFENPTGDSSMWPEGRFHQGRGGGDFKGRGGATF